MVRNTRGREKRKRFQVFGARCRHSRGTCKLCMRLPITSSKMLLGYRSCFYPRKMLINVLIKRDGQILIYNQLKKWIHLTKVNHDVGEGLLGVGIGLTGLGSGTAAQGLGRVFGSGLLAMSRNPSLNTLPTNMLVGAALAEALGLFSTLLGFLLLQKI